MSQANPNTLSRLFDFGSGVGSDNIVHAPSRSLRWLSDTPHRTSGYETLLLTVYDGTQLKQRLPLFLANDSIPADSSWHHVTLVLTSDSYYAYLDGVTRPNARASSFTPGTGTVPKRTRITHYVGAGWPAGSGPYAYGVELADFRVYSAALSAAQVADVAQGTVPRDRPPLELHYKFDTCGGTVRAGATGVVPEKRRGSTHEIAPGGGLLGQRTAGNDVRGPRPVCAVPCARRWCPLIRLSAIGF
eukprot:tig00000178_g12821.t1